MTNGHEQQVAIEAQSQGESVQVTLRGNVEQVIRVLIIGLPPEAIEQLHAAIEHELVERRHERERG